MPEYTSGHQTILHDDGSFTHITVEHEPPAEPMSKAAAIFWIAGTTFAGIAVAGLPLFLFEWEDRHSRKKVLAERQRLNKEVFLQAKAN